MREVSDLNILNKFVIDFSNIVKKYCEYIVVSGFVAISTGRVRGTEDIDMIIRKLEKEEFGKLVTSLNKKFICLNTNNISDMYEILCEKGSIRFSYINQDLPEMELKFEKGDLLDSYQFETKTKIPLTNLDIYFSSIEMNIAFKEEYLKSQKDLEDSKHLRSLFDDEIKEVEIEKIKKMIKEFRL